MSKHLTLSKMFLTPTTCHKIFVVPYVNAKTQMAPMLLDIIVKQYPQIFIEAMCGSAEVSLQFMKLCKDNGMKMNFILNDNNYYLMMFHWLIKTEPNMLMSKLKRLSKSEFDHLRDSDDYSLIDIFNLWINSRHYFLKFKGKHFLGRWNENFQVHLERIPMINELYNYHNVRMMCKDYSELFDDFVFKVNVLVYYDPPSDLDFTITIPYNYILTTTQPLIRTPRQRRSIEKIKCMSENRYQYIYTRLGKNNITPETYQPVDLKTIVDLDADGMALEKITEDMLTSSQFISSRFNKR